MKILMAVLLSQLLRGQEPAKTEPAQAPAPAAAVESPFKVETGLGVRFHGGIKGNFDAYRSMINLGEGFRLVNWDMQYHSDSNTFLKKAFFSGAGWGGDPAAWMRGAFEDSRYYRLNVDYRSTAYFSALPSFANPTLDRGILFSQRSFDTRRHFTELNLDLFPTRRIVPFVSYSRSRGEGRGVSSFTTDANEYPVATLLSDAANLVRGGVRLEFRKFHFTLEQGGIFFHDGQSLFQDGRNNGNATRPFLGQTLFLTNLLQSYAVQGRSYFERGLLTAQPISWLDLSASFQFSRPSSDITYRQTAKGQFVDISSLVFYNSQDLRLVGASNQPHTTASAGAELRPFQRFRLIGSMVTDRLHNTATADTSPFVDRLEWSYNQEQVEAVFEVNRKVLIRGGQRYVWGDSLNRTGQVSQMPQERATLRRNSALGGVGFRATDRASLNADVEIARSEQVLYRTSLSDFERIRVRGRYSLLSSLQLYGTFQYLNNSNPSRLNRFEMRSQQTAAGLRWLPRGGKTIQVMSEYARSTIRSDVSYWVPQILQPARSFYRENAHTITGLFTYRMAVGWTWHPEIAAGGSLFLSNGSRPVSYYQPVIRLTAPLRAHLDFFGEYRWYGVTQNFYLFEGFRSHQGIVGIRIY
ncbi:MAG: hypothetical protein HYZ37_02595 [Candidatus Solibacter usitatus]|nr:hypothetical protein [Candidatus Solibacter usitatus]